jgi:hypothetical protein
MEHSEWIEKITGLVSMLLFISANAYYPFRFIANKYRPLPLEIEIFWFFRKLVEAD